MADLKQIIEEFEKSEKEAGVLVGKWLWLDLEDAIKAFQKEQLRSSRALLSRLPVALEAYQEYASNPPKCGTRIFS